MIKFNVSWYFVFLLPKTLKNCQTSLNRIVLKCLQIELSPGLCINEIGHLCHRPILENCAVIEFKRMPPDLNTKQFLSPKPRCQFLDYPSQIQKDGDAN